MFTTLIVQPIFNLLVFIYAMVPGHNFGLAIILFTILVRLLMWPLVKKQINHSKAMRELQPEIKKIKAAAKGDRKKESLLIMELYKEKEIRPLASLGIIFVQLPILLGLYSGLRKIINDPGQITHFSYSFVQNLGWIKHLSTNIHNFDNTLLGAVDLTRTAVGKSGIYWPAMAIVIASAITQYLQSKQLMPQDPQARSLRKILSEAGSGKQADQSEVNAAVGRGTVFIVPFMVFAFSISLPAALPLYWLASSGMAFFQQSRILNEDVKEAEDFKPAAINKTTHQKNKKKKPSSAKRRRK